MFGRGEIHHNLLIIGFFQNLTTKPDYKKPKKKP